MVAKDDLNVSIFQKLTQYRTCWTFIVEIEKAELVAIDDTRDAYSVSDATKSSLSQCLFNESLLIIHLLKVKFY